MEVRVVEFKASVKILKGYIVLLLYIKSQYLISFFKGMMFKGYDVDVLSFKLPKNFHMQYISR